MTDPIPDEAVEAAARDLYIAEHAQHPGAAQTWNDGYKAQEDWMLVWFARALVALTAAAPHIAAQATADLRAGIEALRDVTRLNRDAQAKNRDAMLRDGDIALAEYCKGRVFSYGVVLDALDALLRGAK